MAAFTQELKAKGLTPAVRRELIGLFNGVNAVYQGIKDKLDRPIKASDPQLIDARKSLSTYLGYQIAVNKLFFSSSSVKDYGDRVNAQYGSKLPAVVQRLRFLSVAIEARYPQVKDWGFLPAK